MDITRLFVGIVMLVPVAMVLVVVLHADRWRAAVNALHLNWERQQRQSAPNAVPFIQRQNQQDRFEDIVSSRPMKLVWLHLAIVIAAVVFGLLLAWDMDDLEWIVFWLVAPFGLAALFGTGFAWLLLNGASGKLSAISSTLYGPAPPRVKVSSIRLQQDESAES